MTRLHALWTQGTGLRARFAGAASVALAALALAPAPALAADPPEIESARAVYQQVEQLRKAGRLRLSRDGAETEADEARCGCAPYGATSACTLGRDAQGVARWFEREGGSDDSLMRERLYYDGQGRLRFIFVHMGAVNGTVQEHRIYFGEQGQRVRASFKTVSGPGYTFPQTWSAQYELRQPKLPAAQGRCTR